MSDSEHDRLEAAYREYGDAIWTALLRYAADPEIANEAVAEAFFQAARRGAAIRTLRPWLFTSAFRIARGLLKSGQLGPRDEALASLAVSDSAETLNVELTHLSEALTPLQRRVFVLRDLLGFSTAEVSGILGVSQGSVRVHLHHARRQLKAWLNGDELDE
jgi:RNA polymerase sigma factor (sigma-70 family)